MGESAGATATTIRASEQGAVRLVTWTLELSTNLREVSFKHGT